MRVLLTSAPMHGHILQLVPLSWALRAAGHEVLLTVPEGSAQVAIEAGLPAVENAEPVPMSEMIGRERDGTPVPWPASPEAKVRRSGSGFGRLAVRVLQGTLRIAERWRPDLVVSEPTEYAGRMVSARLGVPWVEHGWGLPPSPLYAEAAAAELEPELAAWRLTALPEPRLVLDVCPPRMQGPDPRAVPVRRMRYVPYNGSAAVPPWALRPAGRPRVCVTLGSVLAAAAPGLWAEVLTAMGRMDAEVVLATDPAQDLGPLPPTVRAVDWLPLTHVLPSCDLVVHHGGPGTTMTSLVHGLPQLVLAPLASDMAEYGRRVTACGAGSALPAGGATAARIERECRRLLEDPRHRSGARALAEDIARQPSPARTVPSLVRVAHGAAPDVSERDGEVQRCAG
ncbi:nucleotide disphospho-sugar-binding domain-containing protein [Streptomyces tsukubensis]|nr:nucleotide disphospho-sugar-binding domain-containing protein [Streptomyces tsukubensis]